MKVMVIAIEYWDESKRPEETYCHSDSCEIPSDKLVWKTGEQKNNNNYNDGDEHYD